MDLNPKKMEQLVLDDKHNRWTQDQQLPQQSFNRGGIMSVQVQLPDGVTFSTVLNFADIPLVDDLVKVITEKTGLTPTDDYELTEVKTDSVKSLKGTDEAYITYTKIKASKRQLGIRNKKQIGQRRMTFNSGKKVSQPESQSEGPSFATTTLRRLASIGKKPTSTTGTDFFAVVKTLTNPAKTEVKIDSLDTNELRRVQIYIAENLGQLFEGTDHTLSFTKLTQRERFMSQSSSKRTSTDSKAPKPFDDQVFGSTLKTIMDVVTLNDPIRKLPPFFQQAILYLEDKTQTQGLFRINGSAKKVKSLKEDIDNGKDLQLQDDVKPHDVTGVLKLWFRELADPVMTFKLFEYYLQAARFLEGQMLLQTIKMLNVFLPVNNIRVLEALMVLLNKVGRQQDLNQMTSNNLAIVIGPNILRAKDEKAESILNVNELITKVVEIMIIHADTVFSITKDLVQASQKQQVNQ